jgi:hypothetical protein
MKKFFYLLMLTLGCGVLFAQSKPPITQTVRYLTPENISGDAEPAAGTPLILNEFVIMGPNIGVGCYDCVTGAATPNLGIIQPIGLVSTNVSYQVSAFLINQNYTGSCTFTFAVARKTTTIYSAAYVFPSETPSTIFLGSAITIPTGTAKGGATLSLTSVCGASTTKSNSEIYITN